MGEGDVSRCRDWSKATGRDRIARQGAESARTGRAGAGAAREAASAEIVTRVLRCRCGHRGKVELPAELLAGRKFRCSKCRRLLK